MTVKGSRKDLYDVLPVMSVKDGCIVSRRGDVTFCWEVTLPPAYSITEAGYDETVHSFESAVKLLPAWTILHRQDVYLRNEWKGTFGKGFLSDSFNAHFDGRSYMTHRQFLFLTFAGKLSVLRSNSSTAGFGFPSNLFAFPKESDIDLMAAKAAEFITVVQGNGYMKARTLSTEEIEGLGSKPGLIEEYLSLGRCDNIRDDIYVEPGRLEIGDKSLLGFKISESEQFQGNSISNITKVGELSGETSSVYLSFASGIGSRLDCEHVVNQYVVIPDQQELLRDLDKRRRKMLSMSKDAGNNVNSKQLEDFLLKVRESTLLVCMSHMNLLAWCKKGEEEELRGDVSKAFAGMDIVGSRPLDDLFSLFLAGCPGGAAELGKDNYMTQELVSMLCMGINESYDDGMPGGQFLVTDRVRHIPVPIDIQLRAQALHHIDNFNVFLLGPSGSGKSFFMNYFLRQCYDNGEAVFMIDKGGSYRGLTGVIHELSGGKDGTYMTWDMDNPPSFNPFIGWEDWVDDRGRLRQDADGIQAFLSAIQFLWEPKGGWIAANFAILEKIVTEFIYMAKAKGMVHPVFDDFYQFVAKSIMPRIVPVLNDRGEVEKLPENPFIVAYNPVTPDQFDVAEMLRALSSFSADGTYAFFLNNPEPKDLVSDRFTVIEVDKIADGDKTFYSLCILFIMNTFNIKMRSTGGFKRFGLDEAWAAIMNPVFEPFILSLWKTARKFQTSAMVITQELDDILKSQVIRQSIIVNSDTKILLNQKKNEKKFDDLAAVLALTGHQRDVILSMGKAHDPKLPYYTDVYIGMLDCYGVYSIEESPEGVISYESDIVKKEKLMQLARERGSIVVAIEELAKSKKK